MKRFILITLTFIISAIFFCGCDTKSESDSSSYEEIISSLPEQSYYDAEFAKITFFSFSHTGKSNEQNYSYIISKDGSKLMLTFEIDGNLKQIVLKNDKLITAIDEVASKYNVKRWNGFSQKKPAAANETFELIIRYSNGDEINASGENAFPAEYIKIWNAFGDVFAQYEELNEINRPPVQTETSSPAESETTPSSDESSSHPSVSSQEETPDSAVNADSSEPETAESSESKAQ